MRGSFAKPGLEGRHLSAPQLSLDEGFRLQEMCVSVHVGCHQSHDLTGLLAQHSVDMGMNLTRMLHFLKLSLLDTKAYCLVRLSKPGPNHDTSHVKTFQRCLWQLRQHAGNLQPSGCFTDSQGVLIL